MKKTLSLLLVLAAASAFGQVKRIQFNLSGNHTLIPSVEASSVSMQTPLPAAGYHNAVFTGSVKESFEGGAGLNFSGTFDYTLSSKLFLSTGLGVSYLHYKRSFSVGLPDQDFQTESLGDTRAGAPLGSIVAWGAGDNRSLYGAQPTVITSAKSGQTSVLYIQLPVLVGTSFFHDKLFLRGGATLSWLMASAVYRPQYTPEKGIEEVRITDNESFSPLLVSATVNASYQVLKKLSIDASAQQYLTPIYSSNFRTAGNARYTVIGLGISYVVAR